MTKSKKKKTFLKARRDSRLWRAMITQILKGRATQKKTGARVFSRRFSSEPSVCQTEKKNKINVKIF